MYEVNLYAAYEQRQIDANRPRSLLPITLVTGFLGAGKTTVVQRILENKLNLRVGAMVNEFGELDHDGAVIEGTKRAGEVVKLAGGCFCCTTSLTGQFKEKVSGLLETPDHSDAKLDYLLIETSGVSDPTDIIASLDMKFGKLTRARLDAVVTVVDADDMCYTLNQERPLSAAARLQLHNADIILLNKCDLLSPEQISLVHQVAQDINPQAALHAISYGNVPIQSILDVSTPPPDQQGVSHETSAQYLRVSTEALRLHRVSKSRSTSAEPSSGGGAQPHHPHLEADGITQVTFSSRKPMKLAALQDWLCSAVPPGIRRVKGVLSFEEDRLTRAVLNLSGRSRLSFEVDGQWEGSAQQYLVLIGTGLDEESLMKELYGMCGDEHHEKAAVLRDIDVIRSLLEDDAYFKLEEVIGEVVLFRFTGEGLFKLTPEQLRLKHGVDLDQVNMSILKAINSGGSSGGGKGFLSYAMMEGDFIALRWAVGGEVKFPEIWACIKERAVAVVAKDLSYISGCNCMV